MKKILTNKLFLLISALTVLIFGVLGAVAVSAEPETLEPQSTVSQTAEVTQSDAQEQTNEEKTETNPEIEAFKTYEDNSLNKMDSAETVLIILLSVLIVAELVGIGVLIVLILKKTASGELTENRSKEYEQF